ncbi:unnamed protein product [Cyclocybe aegerita]|uniref:FAS1 domain-containing protein n=1 Tax=Cyclocybe aegerita TaxID=1973307 RepID=A0A8S0XPZ5_CYCAE|nr:unnamed protein product [Cyclocybe aegerita]
MRAPFALIICTLSLGWASASPTSPDSQGPQFSDWGNLANIAIRLNSSQLGQQLLADLSSGQNFTVFAPTDDALESFSSRVSSNDTFAKVLSYHILPGDFRNTTSTNSSDGGGTTTMTATSTSTEYSTIVREALRNYSSSSESQLYATNPQRNLAQRHRRPYAAQFIRPRLARGNKSQVLAWTRSGETGNVTILNQAFGRRRRQNITIVDSSILRNLFVNRINGVLIPPGNLSTALRAVNATAARAILSVVQVPSTDGYNVTALNALEGARGITLFIPNNRAFTAEINQTVQGLQGVNRTALAALIQNHYINGTTLYAPNLAATTDDVISAAGEPFQFSTNDTGTYVNVGNSSIARIVRPDVLLKNGVAHVIDRVLAYTGGNPDAASSAYDSATSVATFSTTETAPITNPYGLPTSTTTETTETTTQPTTTDSYSTTDFTTPTPTSTTVASTTEMFTTMSG